MNTLAPSIAERLQEHGFAIVPEVLTAETLGEAISEIESALRSAGAAARGDYAMRHFFHSVPAVRALAEMSVVRQLVEPILGPNCFVARSIFFDKTEVANWKVPWHQDLTIAVAARVEVPGFTAWSVKDGVMHVQPPVALLERMLTVRLHLDDCDPENGPLQVISGSHKTGRLDAESIAHWKGRQPPAVCALSRGGAVLMRPLLLHASSAAITPKHRRVVHLEFASEPLPDGLSWAI